MLILRSSAPSPFGRKIKIALAALGLKDRVTMEEAATADPNDSLRSQNPLGKIPALVLEDGSVLYDSRVISEYIDFLAGGNKIIPLGEARFAALRNQALADGIMDAGILQVYEKRFKPMEYRFPDWQIYQADKIARALAYLEANVPATVASEADLDVGNIAIACALGYLDMRFEGAWRPDHPKMVAWLEAFETAVPSYAETRTPAAPVPENEPAPLR
ncbi:glutathione S-transferase [Roseibium hamelinense]|uniref:Glutathione S-transferase n=1 Tax=Roseibium hamelinense TaxID=150831 RepID=A0A562SXY3_9HYPH|nr:glutathione S-transferase family protein [Roseibium hamelinense]MTI43654.1 glutathione S-transferase family protein [Roseibium hamelinense]TWI86172.1 glutathione S-transferase [Roseibium hamelinense]